MCYYFTPKCSEMPLAAGVKQNPLETYGTWAPGGTRRRRKRERWKERQRAWQYGGKTTFKFV